MVPVCLGIEDGGFFQLRSVTCLEIIFFIHVFELNFLYVVGVLCLLGTPGVRERG